MEHFIGRQQTSTVPCVKIHVIWEKHSCNSCLSLYPPLFSKETVFFTFFCTGSSWLCRLLSSCSEWAVPCSDAPWWGAWAQAAAGFGLSCPLQAGPSQTRGERVSCTGGRVLTTSHRGSPPAAASVTVQVTFLYIVACMCIYVYTLKTFNTIWQTIFFLPTAYNGYWDNWTSVIFLKSVYCTFSTLVSLFEFWLSFPSYWLAVYTFYFYYFNVCS